MDSPVPLVRAWVESLGGAPGDTAAKLKTLEAAREEINDALGRVDRFIAQTRLRAEATETAVALDRQRQKEGT